MRFCLGVDLGSEGDPSSLCMVERKLIPMKSLIPKGSHKFKLPKKGTIAILETRFMQNIPLYTPYPEVVDAIKVIMEQPEFVGQCWLVVDRTGVGLPVIQMMPPKGLNPVGVTITSGEDMNVTHDHYNVPKKDLVTALVTAGQTGRFKIPRPSPRHPWVSKFEAQLEGFKMKLKKKTGAMTYEAETESVHDDMVIASALAVWWMDLIHGVQVLDGQENSGEY